jgi:hypothetical protein
MSQTACPRRCPAAAALALLLAVAPGVSPAPAGAQLVVLQNTGRAEAELTYGGMFPPGRTDTRSFGPFGGAAVAEATDVFGRRTRAVQTGYGLNAAATEARLGDVPFFAYRADTDFEVRVGNGGARSGEDLFFEYVLNGGELRLRAPGGNFDGLVATVGSTIFVLAPGFSGFLWSWQLELRGSGSQVTATESQIFGDPLGLGTPVFSAITRTADEAIVSIGSFHGAADLGVLGRQSEAVITYDMFATIAGRGLNLTGGRASLGDPFDVEGSPGSALSIRGLASLQPTAAVPEPATLALVALGLGILGAVGTGRRHPR